MNEIKLIQSPIIEHDLVRVGQSVTERLEALNIKGQVVTDDTIQILKKLRADLNKESREWAEQIKVVDEIASKPIRDFKEIAKTEIVEKYKEADEILKNKIGEFENNLKSEKREVIISYFAELCVAENIDFLTFDKLGIEINLSTSEKAYKEKCFEFVSKVVDEINLIKTNKYEAEIMVEYKKTLNAAKAIREVQDRKEAEKIEKERIHLQETQRRQRMIEGLSMFYHDITKSYNNINNDSIFILNSDIENLSKDEFNKRFVQLEAQSNAEPLKAPVVEQPKQKEEIVVASFEVTGTMTQLKALGEYLKINNINYKNI
jgi:hypothetical protein